MSNWKYINEFEAIGRMVSRKNFGQNTELITLIIKNHNGRDMYPQFVCRSDILPEIGQHKNLTIKGHVDSLPWKGRGENSIKYRQRFIADSVEFTKTLTEEKFGAKGKFPPESKMFIYLKGTITIITEEKEWFQYHISVGKKVVTVSMKKLDRHLKLNVGDMVCCVCRVSTVIKGDGDDIKRFENIQITDLAKLG